METKTSKLYTMHHAHICTHTHTHKYIHVHACIVHMCTHTHQLATRTHKCIHACIVQFYIYEYTCVHIHTSTCHTRTHTHTHAHTHTYSPPTNPHQQPARQQQKRHPHNNSTSIPPPPLPRHPHKKNNSSNTRDSKNRQTLPSQRTGLPLAVDPMGSNWESLSTDRQRKSHRRYSHKGRVAHQTSAKSLRDWYWKESTNPREDLSLLFLLLPARLPLLSYKIPQGAPLPFLCRTPVGVC